MAENREKPQETPQQSSVDELFSFLKRSRAFIEKAWYKVNNLEKSNMELGIKQLRNGQYFDASLRFRFVLWLNKENTIAWYLLGKSYFFDGKFDKAVPALNTALARDTSLEEARFMLAATGQPSSIKAIPRAFIVEKLDFMANRYEEFTTNVSSHLNSVLKEELFKTIGDNMGFNVLDLGCRGGDSAQTLRNVANAIVGVEPSLKMVALARNQRIENLLVFNLIAAKFPEDFLKEAKDKFAIALSTYYMDNLGDLDEYFRLVNNVLEPGGLFAFNISQHNGNEDYIFKPENLIFLHSGAYINKLAQKHGFSITSNRPAPYPSGSADIVYILEKK